MDSSPHSIALFLKMRGLVRQLAVMRLLDNRLDPIACAAEFPLFCHFCHSPKSLGYFAIQIILSYWVFVNYYFVNFDKNIFILKQVLV